MLCLGVNRKQSWPNPFPLASYRCVNYTQRRRTSVWSVCLQRRDVQHNRTIHWCSFSTLYAESSQCMYRKYCACALIALGFNCSEKHTCMHASIPPPNKTKTKIKLRISVYIVKIVKPQCTNKQKTSVLDPFLLLLFPVFLIIINLNAM